MVRVLYQIEQIQLLMADLMAILANIKEEQILLVTWEAQQMMMIVVVITMVKHE